MMVSKIYLYIYMTEWSGKGYPIGILIYISIFSSSSYPWLEISRVSILCPAQLFLGVDMILVEIKQTRIPFVKTGVDIDNNNIVWVTQKGGAQLQSLFFFFFGCCLKTNVAANFLLSVRNIYPASTDNCSSSSSSFFDGIVFPLSSVSIFICLAHWVDLDSICFLLLSMSIGHPYPAVHNKQANKRRRRRKSEFMFCDAHKTNTWYLPLASGFFFLKGYRFQWKKTTFLNRLVCSLFHHHPASLSYLLLATHTRLSLTLMNHVPWPKVCCC